MTFKTREAYRAYHRKWMKNWRNDHPELQKQRERQQWQRLRQRVFDYLGGAHCANCGCDDKRLLEVNHRNGGGRQESIRLGSRKILRSILKNQRKDEFDVRCRICNAIYYAEQRYGVKFDVRWRLH